MFLLYLITAIFKISLDFNMKYSGNGIFYSSYLQCNSLRTVLFLMSIGFYINESVIYVSLL